MEFVIIVIILLVWLSWMIGWIIVWVKGTKSRNTTLVILGSFFVLFAIGLMIALIQTNSWQIELQKQQIKLQEQQLEIEKYKINNKTKTSK